MQRTHYEIKFETTMSSFYILICPIDINASLLVINIACNQPRKQAKLSKCFIWTEHHKYQICTDMCVY